MEQNTGASAEADRAATPSEPSQEVSGKAGIPCAFTPGPWHPEWTNGAKDSLVVIPILAGSNDGWAVLGHCGGPAKEANADLIAAAPELYEALILVEHNKWGVSAVAQAKIAAALAKARGEQVSA